MSVDLRSNTMFARISLVLMSDGLIKLEHGATQDRVRRYKYDRIESVVIWRQTPWVRALIAFFVFGLPGIGILFVGQMFATVTGIFLIALAACLMGWYFYCGKTTIRIVRAGETYELVGLFRPGRLKRFRDRLLADINAVQGNSMPPLPPPLPEETPGAVSLSPPPPSG